jgi:hypothetical protein
MNRTSLTWKEETKKKSNNTKQRKIVAVRGLVIVRN